MSDIAIRFDGIFLLGALGVGAVIYLLVALVAAGMALANRTQPGRAWRVARASGVMGAGATALTGGVFAWWAHSPAARVGPDWIDQLVWPWAAVFVVGCVILARMR